MAITIINSTKDFAPVYNKGIVTASSTNVAQPAFSFVFQLYDGGTQISKQFIAPDPVYGYGVLDINKVLESYVSTNFFGLTDGIGTKDCDNCYFDYEVRIGERYEVAGVMTEFLNLASETNTVINASLLNADFINFDYQDYLLNTVNKKFLSSAPKRLVTLNTQGYVNFINIPAPTDFRVITYDSSGGALRDVTFDNLTTSTIGMCPIAPINLNQVTLLTGGVQPIIDATTVSYIVFAQNAGTVSEQLQFELINCDKVTLHFLNDLGGFDLFVFNASEKTNYKFEKEYYKKDANVLQSDGSIVFSQLDREWVNYFVKQTPTMKLTSDWISDEESVWLRQMFSSPEIYAQIGSTMIALKGISELGYDIKQFEYNDLFNIECVIEFSSESYRQRF
jgi:hypothetical protein